MGGGGGVGGGVGASVGLRTEMKKKKVCLHINYFIQTLDYVLYYHTERF